MKKTVRELQLLSALRHLMYKNHELRPAGCDGCKDICGWLTVPGYDGEHAHPLLPIGEEI